MRDYTYERRFELFPENVPNPPVRSRYGAGGGVQLKPLFMQESLTAANSALYHELIRARKRENGAIVASVFSRRGMVLCRKVKKGTNISVRDEADLVKVLGGKRFPPPVRGGVDASRRGPRMTGATFTEPTALAQMTPPPNPLQDRQRVPVSHCNPAASAGDAAPTHPTSRATSADAPAGRG